MDTLVKVFLRISKFMESKHYTGGKGHQVSYDYDGILCNQNFYPVLLNINSKKMAEKNSKRAVAQRRFLTQT